MKKINRTRREFMPVNAILQPSEITGVWSAWCPEIDVASQGTDPENALLMLAEAVRMVVEDSLSDRSTYPPLYEPRRKRVIHPSRLGAKSKEDELWPAFENWEKNKWGGQSFARIPFDELADGSDKVVYVVGQVEWGIRAGMLFVNNPDFDSYGNVPVVRYVVKLQRKVSITRHIDVRASDESIMTPEERFKQQRVDDAYSLNLHADDEVISITKEEDESDLQVTVTPNEWFSSND